MLSAQDVADFFLHPLVEEDGELITNLKLQKLLYYAQGYALAILDRPMFPETIEHWTHGPVVPEIYHKYKNYGYSALPPVEIDLNKYKSEEIHILQRVRNEKGRYTAWALRNKTHKESPWLNTHNNEEMTKESIEKYFAETLLEPGFDFDLERMKKMVDDEFVEIPNEALKNAESFDKFLQGTC